MAASFKFPNVIDPDKCLLEDFEIIAFERSEDSDLYTHWHDSFRTRNLVDPFGQPQKQQPKSSASSKRRVAAQQNGSQPAATALVTSPTREQPSLAVPLHRSPTKSKRSKASAPIPSSPSSKAAGQVLGLNRSIAAATVIPLDYKPRTGPTVPGNGLAIINSVHYNTMPNGKVMAKYKLTKFYNKLRGRQSRRNMVLDRQKVKKLDEILSKCQLNPWLAYTSLRALHLPGDNVNQLSSIAINNNPRLISIPQSQMMNKANVVSSSPAAAAAASASKSKKSKAKSKSGTQPDQPGQQPANPATAGPMHFVYIDPGDIVSYSNRVYPQQINEYRKRSHLLPTSATSKRSSAASYDVFEIMDVLANSDRTKVTITRNANKPAPAGCSIYSHSTNLNTRGIVSTQLHLQARSYQESVGKYYAEERTRLAEEAERMRTEPSLTEQISKYIKLEHTYSSTNDHLAYCPPRDSPRVDSQQSTNTTDNSRRYDLVYAESFEHGEDMIDQLEEEILSIVRPHESRDNDSKMIPRLQATTMGVK